MIVRNPPEVLIEKPDVKSTAQHGEGDDFATELDKRISDNTLPDSQPASGAQNTISGKTVATDVKQEVTDESPSRMRLIGITKPDVFAAVVGVRACRGSRHQTVIADGSDAVNAVLMPGMHPAVNVDIPQRLSRDMSARDILSSSDMRQAGEHFAAVPGISHRGEATLPALQFSEQLKGFPVPERSADLHQVTDINGVGREGVLMNDNGNMHSVSGHISENPNSTLLTTEQSNIIPSATTATVPPVQQGELRHNVGTPGWLQDLSHQLVCFSRDDIHHAELRLHPAELGSLQINLRLNNDQAQVHFLTSDHQVQRVLETALPHLRDSLAESGIHLGESSVGGGESRNFQQSGEHDKRGEHISDGTDEHERTSEIQLIAPSSVQHISGVNTFV